MIKSYIAMRKSAQVTGQSFKEPQMHVGCSLLASVTASVICSLLEGEKVPTFPDLVVKDARNFRTPKKSLLNAIKGFFVALKLRKKLAEDRSDSSS